MIYACCDRKRRDLVAANATLNGVDYLEVVDDELPALDPLRQRTLLVHCLKPVPAGFSASNIELLGGERITPVGVAWAAPASPLPAQLTAPVLPDTAAAEAASLAVVTGLADGSRVVVVRTAVAGDFSPYTLRFVASATDDAPPANFDPQLREIAFHFKVDCPSDFDCKPQDACLPADHDAPDIDYLARDYWSYRRLLLDRVAQLVPDWQQSSEADFGISVAEVLAYAGDQLSYQQDAIATEAYLGTARQRVSLRRHALLVDYPMHDGGNARAWLQLQVTQPTVVLTLPGIQFLTRCVGFPTGLAAGSNALATAMQLQPLVFEPLLDPRLAPTYAQSFHRAHNAMSFYPWSDDRCRLPQGATRATLSGSYPELSAGDALLFEEQRGPATGEPQDADPTHRHVVRLTKVTPPPPAVLTDPLTGDAITEIEWAAADALPFALCISSVTDATHGAMALTDVSVARGNLVLVDHGQRVVAEALGVVPQAVLFQAPACTDDCCNPTPPVPIPPRYRPRLAELPLTHAAGRLTRTVAGDVGTVPAPFDPFGPAADAMNWDMASVLPQIALSSQREPNWNPQPTLLTSSANDSTFVVEVDDDGDASLRFGDGEHGVLPESGTAFTASYRVGNGAMGNVGSESIVHIVAPAGDLPMIGAVRNPLPAHGGIDAEDAASVRRNAPEAFRTQERAVTMSDYAAAAARDGNVQRSAATLRWTGSWHTVFVTVDPVAGADPAGVRQAVAPLLERYRMAGQDLEFDDPHYVSLEVALHACVKDGYLRSEVRARLLDVFSSRVLPDGRRGLFHPDNLTFGQSVFLSTLYAAAHGVPGIASAQVTALQRQGTDDPSHLRKGELPLGRLEIARLDNDPNFPEHGVLRLDLQGGR